MDHLYTALVANGIHTFRDDEELDRGAPGLLKAIEQSRISIVIFSKIMLILDGVRMKL